MSRIKRWINMHKKEFNADGNLKDEVRQQKLSLGAHPGAIQSYARRLKPTFRTSSCNTRGFPTSG